MLTTKQVVELLNFIEPTLQQALAANLVVGQRDQNIDKTKLKNEYDEASRQFQVFFHNARHVNRLQPDCKNTLPPEDDGDVPVASNDPKVPA